MINFLKFTETNLFSLKIELFLKIFSISLSLQIYYFIILNFFFLGKKWVYLIDIILFFRRDIILFSSDLYSSNFCYSVLCFPFLFLQLF